MENYVNLHNHSIYSALDAVCTPEQLIDKAVEYGHKAIAITEHGNFNSVPRFQQYALEKGIKPILGMEGYVVDNLQKFDEKGKRIREKNNHIILHAMNNTGWRNLMILNYLSNSDEEHFYYKPRFSFKELFEHNEGIMLGTACLASPLANLIKRGEEEKAEELFQELILHFKNRLYAEIQINEVCYEELNQKEYNDWLIYQATKNGVPIVLSGDTHYVNKDDWTIQQMAFMISRDGVGEETQHVCKTIYYKGIGDYLKLNKELGFNYPEEKIKEWCNNAVLVAEECNYIYKPSTTSSLPRVAFDEEDEIRRLGEEGLKKHFNVDKLEDCPKEYIDRLNMELAIITKKGMMRYFLVLKDILDWCDEQKIPRGKGRGSASSSLLAGCLNITNLCVDPIKLNLYFDRFISEERLPDAIYRYNINDASLIKNDKISFDDFKKKISNYNINDLSNECRNRLKKELYRARIAYDNGIDLIATLETFKENISNAYVLPYLLGFTKNVDLLKPLEIQSLGIGSSGLDIDSDVSGAGKDRIFQHLQEKYGKDCVCYIGTYTEEGIKPAVKDILRKYEVPFKDSNAFCSSFPENETEWEKIIDYLKTNNPQQYEFYNRYKTHLDFVPKLQHFIRSQGCHAGGNIIFNKPVYEYVPVVRNKGEIATAWVENGSETVLDCFAGTIKYDILGLNTLDIIDNCVNDISEELVEIEDDDKIIKIVPLSYIQNIEN